jgi:uncharacterized RDD family membrane protein YckC
MSAPAFTPGPWGAGSRVIEIGGADLTPVDAAERTVAFVPVAYAADAHLIAAAPKLFEAVLDTIEALKLLRVGLAHDAKVIEVLNAHIEELEYAAAHARGDQ